MRILLLAFLLSPLAGSAQAECVPAAPPFSICAEDRGLDLRSGLTGPSLAFPSVVPNRLPHGRDTRFNDRTRGLELVIRKHPSGMEYDWVVSPGADPGAICMRCGVGSACEFTRDGDLLITKGSVRQQHGAPVAYQIGDGRRRIVDAGVRTDGAGEIGFSVGPYDRSRELIIDPVVKYSVGLGDMNGKTRRVTAVTADAQGNAYVTGWVTADDFPTTPNAYQRQRKGRLNAFVVKINPEGSGVVFSTLIGGSDIDNPSAIAVDQLANLSIRLLTSSFDYPGLAAGPKLQLVITKLKADGTDIVYSYVFPAGVSGVILGIAVYPVCSADFAAEDG